ncbi:MAG: hypothetical protein VKK04_22080, partial [Synechococcales bacterium]|nr:hypothetical protein [Synechococcales bacterium]
PNGILFGPNARLDVNASFLATTADQIQLGDRGFFSATNPADSRLLRVRPSALWFSPNSNSTIINRSRSPSPDGLRNTLEGFPGLRVPSGQTLTLLGGDVQLIGGNLTSFGGHVHLGSVIGGEVAWGQEGDRWTFSYGDVESLGTVHLTDNSAQEVAVVEAGIDGGGSVSVQARDLVIRDGARLSTRPIRGTVEGGDIAIHTTNSVLLSGLTVLPNNFTQPAGIFTSSVGDGPDAGDIFIQTQRLRVEDGAAISSSTFRTGRNSGDITINAAETVQVVGIGVGGEQLLNSAIGASNVGGDTGGDVTINTRRLAVRNGAAISNSNVNGRRGGQTVINASESVVLSGRSEPVKFSFGVTGIASGLFADMLSSVDRPASAQEAGSVEINTRRLLVNGGAYISVSTLGNSQGGDLTINASESVQIQDFFQPRETPSDRFISGLYAQSFGRGTSGNLQINTPRLDVRDGGRVTVASSNFDQVGTSVEALTRLFSVFQPGLCLSCFINEDNLGTGNAGDLTINASIVRLDNQGQISAAAGSGAGGSIFLTGLQDQPLDLLLLLRNSQISTTAGTLQSGGDGGDISINAEFIAAAPQENSNITANAFLGSGGRVEITADGVYNIVPRREENPTSNDITASSTLGIDGVVELETPDVDPSRDTRELPFGIITATVSQRCQPGRDTSSYVETGRGGLPLGPGEAIAPPDLWEDMDAPGSYTHITSVPPPVQDTSAIVEAQGWVISPEGKILLTATAPAATPYSSLRSPTACSATQLSPNAPQP